MKIGLLTVHCSTNPGASLQAYALSKTIQCMGGNVLLIDYRPFYFISEMDGAKKKRNTFCVKNAVGTMLFGRRLRKEYKAYIAFEDHYLPPKTRRYDSLEELNANIPECDAFICGSDQIWNPVHTHYDPTMELSFAKRAGIPCYSYAASIGQDVLNENDLDFLRINLKGFNAISVREDSAKSILEKTLGINNVKRHIDPTLLLDISEWRKIASNAHITIKSKYILFYPLADNAIISPLLKAIKKKYNLPIVAISRHIKKDPSVDFQMRMFTPNDFVDLIDHAEYVVTNSFHGCVFSLLFEKKLIAYKNEKRNSRLECLFDMFGINATQVTSVTSLYDEAFEQRLEQTRINNNILSEERHKALCYLRGILQDG